MKYCSATLVMRMVIVLGISVCIIMFLYLPCLSFLLPKSQRTITILTWTDLIDPLIVARFERQHNARVNLRYFENNEELLVKLTSNNAEGFDIIVPSDYITHKLIAKSLLKKIDKTRLFFWHRLNISLLHPYFDPHNDYSLPYHWGVYGLGVRKDDMGTLGKNSWNILFDNALVTMPNSGRESILIAASYLKRPLEALTDNDVTAIKNNLIIQKKHVEAYVDADIRALHLLLSGASQAVVVASPFMLNVVSQSEQIEFLVPQEVSFIVLDNIVISALSKQDDLVYAFINFLFEPGVLKHHCERYPFIPATNDAFTWVPESAIKKSIQSAHENISALTFFTSNLDEKTLNDIWLSVKVS